MPTEFYSSRYVEQNGMLAAIFWKFSNFINIVTDYSNAKIHQNNWMFLKTKLCRLGRLDRIVPGNPGNGNRNGCSRTDENEKHLRDLHWCIRLM